MQEWFSSAELMALSSMPNSVSGISRKAQRESWESRKASGGGRSLEYHISNFDPHIQKQLKVAKTKTLMDAVEEFVANNPQVEEENKDYYVLASDLKMSSILEFDVQAAAGAGSLVCSEHATGKYSIPTQSLTELGLKEEDAAIVFCSGDSMETLISDGDRIIVDIREQPTPVTNGVYVIRIDDAVYVKKLKWNILEHSYTVASENKNYDDFVLEGDNLDRLKVIGKAKLVMKSL